MRFRRNLPYWKLARMSWKRDKYVNMTFWIKKWHRSMFSTDSRTGANTYDGYVLTLAQSTAGRTTLTSGKAEAGLQVSFTAKPSDGPRASYTLKHQARTRIHHWERITRRGNGQTGEGEANSEPFLDTVSFFERVSLHIVGCGPFLYYSADATPYGLESRLEV